MNSFLGCRYCAQRVSLGFAALENCEEVAAVASHHGTEAVEKEKTYVELGGNRQHQDPQIHDSLLGRVGDLSGLIRSTLLRFESCDRNRSNSLPGAQSLVRAVYPYIWPAARHALTVWSLQETWTHSGSFLDAVSAWLCPGYPSRGESQQRDHAASEVPQGYCRVSRW